MPEEVNFWDQYEKDAASEGGSGGIIAMTVEVETVYKGFVAGLDQAEAYRTIPVGASKKIKAAAKAAILELGADRAQYGVQIRVHRDNAVSGGKPVTWQADRFFFQASWNDACKSVVVPSLKDAGIVALPFKGCARIGFKPNPFNVAQGDAGKTDADQEGNPRFPQVAYIIEVFKDADAARAAIGGEASEDTTPTTNSGNAPDGWELETWKTVWPELAAAKDSGQTNKQIADDYDVPVKFVVQALAAHIPL